MPDAIPSQFMRILTRGALTKNLQAILKSGPQQATVLKNPPGGKLTLLLQGQTFTLDSKSGTFKPGDQVMLRMSGDQVLIQLRARSSQESNSVSTKSLASTLNSMGLSAEQSQPIARALIQAGMPLDPQVLKTLTDLLGKMSPDQISTMAFLFSRGLAITPSLISTLSRLFSNKQRPGESSQRLLAGLSDFLSDMDDEEEPIVGPERRNQLSALLRQLHEKIPSFSSGSNVPSEEEWSDFIRNMLTTPEAILQKSGGEGKDSFAELLLRLLSMLQELKPLVEGTAHEAKWNALLSQAQELHEELSQQALRNLPPHDSPQAPIYLQIPLQQDNESQTLELLYKPKDPNQKSGNLDLRLDLSSLGPMHISMQWSHPNITLSFVCGSENISDFLKDSSHVLEEALCEKGFVVQAINIRVDQVPETLEPQESPQHPSIQHGFDVRI